MVAEMMEKGYQASSRTLQRDHFDFDASIAFQRFDGNIYLRWFADMFVRDTFDWLEKDKRFIEYDYDNRCDRPSEVSEGDWTERRRVWDGIYPDSGLPIQLVLEISRYNMYAGFGLQYAMHDQILKNFGFAPRR